MRSAEVVKCRVLWSFGCERFVWRVMVRVSGFSKVGLGGEVANFDVWWECRF